MSLSHGLAGGCLRRMGYCGGCECPFYCELAYRQAQGQCHYRPEGEDTPNCAPLYHHHSFQATSEDLRRWPHIGPHDEMAIASTETCFVVYRSMARCGTRPAAETVRFIHMHLNGDDLSTTFELATYLQSVFSLP